jgi:hypothetical protein
MKMESVGDVMKCGQSLCLHFTARDQNDFDRRQRIT